MTGQKTTDIPLFLRGGVIVPIRVKSAMTTADLREQDFELLVPVGKDGTAKGTLYLDDGDSLDPKQTSFIEFEYKKGQLVAKGSFGYRTKAKLAKITLLGAGHSKSDKASSSVTVDQPLTQPFSVNL